MTKDLQILYDQLVQGPLDSGNQDFPVWHADLKMRRDEVKCIRRRLSAPGSSGLSQVDDLPFLTWLIYERYNGVASAGQSGLSPCEFKKMISNQNFLNCLSEFIKQPEYPQYENLVREWKPAKGGNNPLRVNRIVAACTDLSTFADRPSFNKLFKILINDNWLAQPTQKIPNHDWFKRNVHLMDKIKSEVKTADPYYQSIFAWIMHEYIGKFGHLPS